MQIQVVFIFQINFYIMHTVYICIRKKTFNMVYIIKRNDWKPSMYAIELLLKR